MSGKDRVYNIKLDKIKCLEPGDDGRSEPYLWNAMIQIDGNHLNLYKNSRGYTGIEGEPLYEFSLGSHGNLGRKSFIDNEVREIPTFVGQFISTARPLDILPNILSIDPIIVFLSILLEADNISPHGAEAAHQAVNEYIKEKVTDFIQTIEIERILDDILVADERGDFDPSDNTLMKQARAILFRQFRVVEAKIKEDMPTIVRNAIENHQNFLENLSSFINPDDLVGYHTTIIDLDSLLNNGSEMDLDLIFSEGDGAYQITGTVTVTAPLIEHGLPNASRLEISRIAKRWSSNLGVGYISHIGGDYNGNPWIVDKVQAAYLVKHSLKSFYVSSLNGRETDVLAARHPVTRGLYLRTYANDITEDNLLSLPRINFFHDV